MHLKYYENMWTGFIWLRIVVGCCEFGTETSGSMRGREFIRQMGD